MILLKSLKTDHIFQEFIDGLKKAGVDTKAYLTMAEKDQNIQTTSLDQFKRIVIKGGMFQQSNSGKSLKNSEKCKIRRLHSAIYCQLCFPHCNINGFQ